MGKNCKCKRGCNFIDPSFEHGTNFKIGRFCIIEADVKVGIYVRIGDYCKLMRGTRIGHGTIIKDHVRLAPKTIIGRNCTIDSFVKSSGVNKIGNYVTLRYDAIIARDVTVEDGAFISPQVMTVYKSVKKEKIGGIVIGKNSFIGTNVTIGHGVKIAKNVLVAQKSNVVKDLTEEGQTYIGNPAMTMAEFKKLRDNQKAILAEE